MGNILALRVSVNSHHLSCYPCRVFLDVYYFYFYFYFKIFENDLKSFLDYLFKNLFFFILTIIKNIFSVYIKAL